MIGPRGKSHELDSFFDAAVPEVRGNPPAEYPAKTRKQLVEEGQRINRLWDRGGRDEAFGPKGDTLSRSERAVIAMHVFAEEDKTKAESAYGKGLHDLALKLRNR